jgi:hypothetical protein
LRRYRNSLFEPRPAQRKFRKPYATIELAISKVKADLRKASSTRFRVYRAGSGGRTGPSRLSSRYGHSFVFRFVAEY